MRESNAETRILDAAKLCCERWGFDRVTIDDIAAAAGVSRATLYRLYPGGKDVLFETLRLREISDFFDTLTAEVVDVADFEDLIVRLVVTATRGLRADAHLAVMLATEPGETLSQFTVEGLPRIIRAANDYLAPLVKPYLDPELAPPLIDLLVRFTISYFLAPSDHVDLGDPVSAQNFLRPAISALVPHLLNP